MVSRHLARLRATQEDLRQVYDSFQEPGAALRGSLKAYSGADPIAKRELQRHVNMRQEQLAALRAQVASDVKAIKARTVSKVQASEPTKSDIRYMLDRGATVHQVSQWIVQQKREDGFSALREVISQQAYSQQNTNAGSRSPAEQVQDAEGAMSEWAKQMMTPAELEAIEEDREVQASLAYLQRNLVEVENYFANNLSEQAWQGGIKPVEKLSKWPGLPSQGLLNDGVSIELANVQ